MSFRPCEPEGTTVAERVEIVRTIAAALGEPTAGKAFACIRLGVATLLQNGVEPAWLLAMFVAMATEVLDGTGGELHGIDSQGNIIHKGPRT